MRTKGKAKPRVASLRPLECTHETEPSVGLHPQGVVMVSGAVVNDIGYPATCSPIFFREPCAVEYLAGAKSDEVARHSLSPQTLQPSDDPMQLSNPRKR